MNCPKCGEPITSVVDSRHIGDTIYRRRECPVCHSRFNTYEVSEEKWSMINNVIEIIKDGLKS